MQSNLYSLGDNTYALQISATYASVIAPSLRLPTHFILLIDTSESMHEDNRLENVKHSASLVLHFLGPQDRISVITFADTAKVCCAAVSCDPVQKATILETLNAIKTDGCTNMSAGLLAMKGVLEDDSHRIEGSAWKTGVILLTDGHANRGVYRAEGIQTILQTIHTAFPAVTFQFVGYGTEHNAALLKDMATEAQGAYSIVEEKEGAATVIGDTLGSLFSCVAQEVRVICPPNYTVEGTQYVLSANKTIEVGDLYDGNETLILLKGPEGANNSTDTIVVTGTAMPSLDLVCMSHSVSEGICDVPTDIQAAATLTRLRYRCAALYKRLGNRNSTTIDFAQVEQDIAAIEAALQEYEGHSVATMLLGECASLREALTLMRTPLYRPPADLYLRMTQHEAFTNLGRGTARPINRGTVDPENDDEDDDPMITTTAAPPPRQYLMSPMRSRTQQRVTRLMATMSMAPESDAADAAHAAAEEFSQMGGV